MSPTRLFTLTAALGVVATPPVAAAQPPGFPDVDDFTPVNAQGYLVQHSRRGQLGSVDNTYYTVDFMTADGVGCAWNYERPGSSQPVIPEILCAGNIPGIPDTVPGRSGPGCGKVSWMPGGFGFGRYWPQCGPYTTHVLSAGQKLETVNATCVVGAESLIACIDTVDNQGFVLQPSGSWVF